MRKSIVAGLGLVLVAGAAAAQTSPPAQSNPQNSVINTPSSSNRQVTAPVSGSNSFTQSEARSRIEKQGYSQVTGLVKDQNGVWRGEAMKGGQKVAVALDYEGNVVQGTSAAGSTSTQGTTGSAVGGNAGR